MNGTYLLNSPFTFQSMEKHSRLLRDDAARAQGPARPCWCPTRTRSTTSGGPTRRRSTTSRSTSTPSPTELGYPLYMKPFDGGGWRGVSRINDQDDLHQGLRRVRRDAHAPAVDRRVRPLRAGPVDRARDDGHGLPAGAADAQPVCRHRTTSCQPSAGHGGRRDQPDHQRVLRLGVQLRARCSSRATRSTRSTTPTPVPTSRSPRCTTTSPGPSRRSCAGRSTAWSPAGRCRSTSRCDRYFDIADDRVDCTYEQKLDRLPRARRRALRRPTATGQWCERVPPPPAGAGARVGARPPTSTGCCARPSTRPTPSTSGSSSWPTSAACSRLWAKDNAAA